MRRSAETEGGVAAFARAVAARHRRFAAAVRRPPAVLLRPVAYRAGAPRPPGATTVRFDVTARLVLGTASLPRAVAPYQQVVRTARRVLTPAPALAARPDKAQTASGPPALAGTPSLPARIRRSSAPAAAAHTGSSRAAAPVTRVVREVPRVVVAAAPNGGAPASRQPAPGAADTPSPPAAGPPPAVPGWGTRPAALPSPPPSRVDVGRLTDDVLRALDRRLLAARERLETV